MDEAEGDNDQATLTCPRRPSSRGGGLREQRGLRERVVKRRPGLGKRERNAQRKANQGSRCHQQQERGVVQGQGGAHGGSDDAARGCFGCGDFHREIARVSIL